MTRKTQLANDELDINPALMKFVDEEVLGRPTCSCRDVAMFGSCGSAMAGMGKLVVSAACDTDASVLLIAFFCFDEQSLL